jgi:hypothetical protein
MNNFKGNCITAFQHLHTIFQYRIAITTPSAAVYGFARSIDVHCAVYVCLSTASSMDMQGVFLSIARSMDMKGCTPFLNAGMSDCLASSQPGIQMDKKAVVEPVRYRNKGTQSGTVMLRYWTEVQDAGMPMPVASTSMLMPSYD